MIRLRLEGWSYSALGREFRRDHSTIMYHCQRMHIVYLAPVSVEVQTFIDQEEDVEEIPKVVPKYAHLIDETMNRGKSYQEYLNESLQRKIEKRYHDIYHKKYAGPANLTPKDLETGGELDAEDLGVVQGELP